MGSVAGTFRATAIVAAALFAGCGGDTAPSADERRAAMGRWQQRADAACGRAAAEIAARGEPTDLVDLDRIVVRSTADLRRASTAIRRLEAPAGEEPRVRAVNDAIARLEKPLTTLNEWSEVGKHDEMVKAVVEFREELWHLQTAADKAGLEECGRREHRRFATDALLAPIYADALEELYRTLIADLDALRQRGPTARGRAAVKRYFESLDSRLYMADAAMNQLEPPQRAKQSAQAFQNVLTSMGGVYYYAAEQVGKGANLARIDAHVARSMKSLRRDERRAAFALARDLAPLPPADRRGGDGDSGNDIS